MQIMIQLSSLNGVALPLLGASMQLGSSSGLAVFPGQPGGSREQGCICRVLASALAVDT